MPRKSADKAVSKYIEKPEITKKWPFPFGLKNLRILLIFLLVLGIALYFFMTYFVIAWVDKFPITRFEYWNTLEKTPEATQVREQMVIERLLLHEQRKRNIEVTDKEIEEEFKKVEEQIGKENIENQLNQFNLTKDEFKKQLRIRLVIKKMFGQDIKVSNEELEKYTKDSEQNLSSEKIKEQLIAQKTQENFLSWLEEAQKSPRVLRLTP